MACLGRRRQVLAALVLDLASALALIAVSFTGGWWLRGMYDLHRAEVAAAGEEGDSG